MNALQVSTVVIMGLGAFVLAIVCVAVGLSFLHVSRKDSSLFFAPMLIILTTCGILSVALSGRLLQSEVGAANSEYLLQEVANRLPVKLLLGGLATLAIIALAGRAFQARQPPNLPAALTASFLGFYLASNVVPAALGYEPVFLYGLVYTPIILLALLVTAPANPQTTLRAVKAALLLIVVSSLIAALVAPSLALQNSDKALIPGYGIRLWGLTSHANVLGPAALTLCLIEWAAPYKYVVAHRLTLLSGFTALIWTQSKTSILAALIAALVIFSYRTFRSSLIPKLMPGLQSNRRHYAPVIALAAGLLIVISILIAVVFSDSIAIFSSISRRLATFDWNTFQGRTLIWHQAITEGLKNPLFGYGLNLWSAEYRAVTGLNSAFHAHNQFLQVFSVAGAFGTLAMVIYLLVLGRMSIAVARASRGVSLALFAVLIVRSLTEVPIQFGAFIGGDFLSHLAFLLFVGALHSQAKSTAVAVPHSPPVSPAPHRFLKGAYGLK